MLIFTRKSMKSIIRRDVWEDETARLVWMLNEKCPSLFFHRFKISSCSLTYCVKVSLLFSFFIFSCDPSAKFFIVWRIHKRNEDKLRCKQKKWENFVLEGELECVGVESIYTTGFNAHHLSNEISKIEC